MTDPHRYLLSDEEADAIVARWNAGVVRESEAAAVVAYLENARRREIGLLRYMETIQREVLHQMRWKMIFASGWLLSILAAIIFWRHL